jgi:hypothetical protein
MQAMWRNLHEDLIIVRENCVLLHPGGKNFGTCHLDAPTGVGKEKCVRHLLLYEGYEKVMAWLESVKGVALSGVVDEAIRLVVGFTQ